MAQGKLSSSTSLLYQQINREYMITIEFALFQLSAYLLLLFTLTYFLNVCYGALIIKWPYKVAVFDNKPSYD